MYRSKYVSPNPSLKVIRVKGVQTDLRGIDALTAGDYVLNAAGFLRSDFSILNQTNDQLEMARVLARMQEIQPEPNPDRSFEDIVKELKPRWAQLPAELDRFEQYCIENSLEYYRKFVPEEEENDPGEATSSPSSAAAAE